VGPRRVINYGMHGVGKSTWASRAPSPLVLTIEDGLNDLEVDRTPLLRRTADVAQWLIELGGEEPHGYKTVVIDTLDWLEKLIWSATCEDAGKKSIEDFGYGRGYALSMKRWEMLLLLLDCCRAKGMNIVLLAHARIEKFSPPDADSYDRWTLDLHKTASALVQEWADEVLFSTYQVSTIKRDEGFRERTRAIGGSDRIVHTTEAATHAAKRRIVLPDVLPLEWSEYQKHWPVSAVPTGDVAGIVTNGHSKQKDGDA